MFRGSPHPLMVRRASRGDGFVRGREVSMELFGKVADLCQALVVLLLVFQVSALFRSVNRLREKGEQLENRVDDIRRGNRGR